MIEFQIRVKRIYEKESSQRWLLKPGLIISRININNEASKSILGALKRITPYTDKLLENINCLKSFKHRWNLLPSQAIVNFLFGFRLKGNYQNHMLPVVSLASRSSKDWQDSNQISLQFDLLSRQKPHKETSATAHLLNFVFRSIPFQLRRVWLSNSFHPTKLQVYMVYCLLPANAGPLIAKSFKLMRFKLMRYNIQSMEWFFQILNTIM